MEGTETEQEEDEEKNDEKYEEEDKQETNEAELSASKGEEEELLAPHPRHPPIVSEIEEELQPGKRSKVGQGAVQYYCIYNIRY